jgi:glucosamine--fructose-6-phosphate aminotransferase (isomerizing)
MSAMGETMATQPALLRELLADPAPPETAAKRIAGRRVLLVGTGTSWHAANQGAWLLRAAGAEAWPVQAVDAADAGPRPGAGDALVLLSHRGTKRYTSTVLERARAEGAETVVISGRGSPGADIETSEPERSSAFTASHLGALMRLAQIAVALGADLGRLGQVPDVVEAVLDAPAPGVEPPERLLEFVGAGPNQWTAAEGALKVRETCYVATEGLSVEQLLHGPSVALREGDTLVALNGGGPGEGRLLEIARLAETCGARVHTIAATYPSELLSIFPLTAAVQRIALDCAESLGTNPDSFGRDLPGRAEALEAIEL